MKLQALLHKSPTKFPQGMDTTEKHLSTRGNWTVYKSAPRGPHLSVYYVWVPVSVFGVLLVATLLWSYCGHVKRSRHVTANRISKRIIAETRVSHFEEPRRSFARYTPRLKMMYNKPDINSALADMWQSSLDLVDRSATTSGSDDIITEEPKDATRKFCAYCGNRLKSSTISSGSDTETGHKLMADRKRKLRRKKRRVSGEVLPFFGSSQQLSRHSSPRRESFMTGQRNAPSSQRPKTNFKFGIFKRR